MHAVGFFWLQSRVAATCASQDRELLKSVYTGVHYAPLEVYLAVTRRPLQVHDPTGSEVSTRRLVAPKRVIEFVVSGTRLAMNIASPVQGP